MTEYAATTTNASNKVTATPTDEEATVKVLLGETEIENKSSPSWEAGENVVTVTVSKDGAESRTYTVTVTKS